MKRKQASNVAHLRFERRKAFRVQVLRVKTTHEGPGAKNKPQHLETGSGQGRAVYVRERMGMGVDVNASVGERVCFWWPCVRGGHARANTHTHTHTQTQTFVCLDVGPDVTFLDGRVADSYMIWRLMPHAQEHKAKSARALVSPSFIRSQQRGGGGGGGVERARAR